MGAAGATELILIRHAPALHGGRLCGRTDVAADLSGAGRLRSSALAAGEPVRLVVSPALRCRQTAGALWPGVAATPDPRLWEQDFGAWEGLALARLPDLGPLSRAELAAHRPPGGESFADLCARAGPALTAIAADGSATVVAHAGIVRAALALAIGTAAAALAFDVAPLSVTRLTRLGDGPWAITGVNWTPGP
ncbi:MAG: histidine phosphatase family protein [Proteobacteria bacterium]|nr:histidine phosphatase family protein [Pseudomonadota bacterium]MBS0572128.1 histidine phosphatase family protein [Pseudomonadota bacterium]